MERKGGGEGVGCWESFGSIWGRWGEGGVDEAVMIGLRLGIERLGIEAESTIYPLLGMKAVRLAFLPAFSMTCVVSDSTEQHVVKQSAHLQSKKQNIQQAGFSDGHPL